MSGRLTGITLLLVAALAAEGASAAGTAPTAKAPARTAKPAATAGARAGAAKRDTVLARIGGTTITSRDVQERIEELPEPYRTNYATPDGRTQFLERLIEERVWLIGAKKHGIADRPEVKKQIESSERDLLIRTYVSEVMAENPTPPDSEARAWYDAHVADYRQPATVTLRHIQSKTEADARKVKAWAKSGQDWTRLAARYSTDSLTKNSGGALGTVTREGVFGAIGPQPALAESAFALGSHAIGGPYQTSRGWHVIQVDTVRAESVRPFEQVRTVILRQLAQTQTQEFYKQRLADEKKKLGFTPDSAAIKAFISQKESAQELFRRGQEGTVPTTRIAAYKRVVSEYPDSPVSPQAQFMIGFIYSEELKNYNEAEDAFRELLNRYPKSELVESARWMIAHMRTEEAPPFMNLDSDSTRTATQAKPSGKP
jgi:peptidyl-prolyl cis-trans isomerase C